MDWKSGVSWLFQAIISASVMYGVNELGALRTGVQDLNVKMATVITTMGNQSDTLMRHEAAITKVDDRVRVLERAGKDEADF